MTLRQAAEWLGMGDDRAAGLRLKRLLEAKEREGGRQILIRRGEGPGSRLLVTRALLRAHVPEIWSPEEAVVELVRERLGAIEGELERGRIERRVLGRKIARMEAQLVRVEGSPPTGDVAARQAGEATCVRTVTAPPGRA